LELQIIYCILIRFAPTLIVDWGSSTHYINLLLYLASDYFAISFRFFLAYINRFSLSLTFYLFLCKERCLIYYYCCFRSYSSSFFFALSLDRCFMRFWCCNLSYLRCLISFLCYSGSISFDDCSIGCVYGTNSYPKSMGDWLISNLMYICKGHIAVYYLRFNQLYGADSILLTFRQLGLHHIWLAFFFGNKWDEFMNNGLLLW
jgi:hypothetical protein